MDSLFSSVRQGFQSCVMFSPSEAVVMALHNMAFVDYSELACSYE